MILNVSMKGETRLEALHSLLSELNRLEVIAEWGVVVIEPFWKNALRGNEVKYEATWTR